MQEEKEEKGFPFRDFLQNNSAYGGLCDSFFAKPFHGLLITALDYCHQMDLHLNQGQSNLLDEKKQQLFSCMEDILSRIEEPYAAEVQAAFDAFKQQHGNDKPVHAPVEFQQLLDAFLEVVANQIKTPPPTGTTGSVFFLFLEERFSGLVSAIREDQCLTSVDKTALSFFILVLSRDSVDQSLDLTNRGLFESQGIQNPAVSEYMDALRGAYAVYMGELSLAHGPSAEK